MRPACPSPRTWRSSEPKDFKLIGTPAKRLDTAGEGQRNGRLRHRRSAAGREDRDAGAIAGVRRPREERRRHGGQGGQGRAPDRAARRCRRRRGRSHGRREEGPGGARRSNGTTVRTPSSTPQTIARELEQATLKPGAVAQNIGDVDKAHGGRRHQGRGDLPAFRSSRTRRWSR